MAGLMVHLTRMVKPVNHSMLWVLDVRSRYMLFGTPSPHV